MPTTAQPSAKLPASPAPKLSALADAHARTPAQANVSAQPNTSAPPPAPAPAGQRAPQAQRAQKPGAQPLENTARSQPLQLSLDARDHLHSASSVPSAPTPPRSPWIWAAVGVIVIAGFAITYILNRREPSADTLTTTGEPAVPIERVEAQTAPTAITPEPTPTADPSAQAPAQEQPEKPAPVEEPQAAKPEVEKPRAAARPSRRVKQKPVPKVDGPILLVKPSRPAVSEDDDELKAAARAAERFAADEAAPPSPDGE